MKYKTDIIVYFWMMSACAFVVGCHAGQTARSAGIGAPCETLQSMGKDSAGWECVRGVVTCAAESGCQLAGMHYPAWYVLGTEPKPPKKPDGYILTHQGYMCDAESCAGGESAVRKDTYCNNDQFDSGDGVGSVWTNDPFVRKDDCGKELCGSGGVCAEGRCLCDGKTDGPVNKNEYVCRNQTATSGEKAWFCNNKTGCTCGDVICPESSQCYDGRCLCGTMDVTPTTSQQQADIVTLWCFNDQLTCMEETGCSCGGEFCPHGSTCRDGHCTCGKLDLSAHGPNVPTDLSGYFCDNDLLLQCTNAASCPCGDEVIEINSYEFGYSEGYKYCVNGEILELDYDDISLSEKSDISGGIRVKGHISGSCGGGDYEYDICIDPNGCMTRDGYHIPFLYSSDLSDDLNDYTRHLDTGYFSLDLNSPNIGYGESKVCMVLRENALPLSIAGDNSKKFVCDRESCDCGKSTCHIGELCDNGKCSEISGCGRHEDTHNKCDDGIEYCIYKYWDNVPPRYAPKPLASEGFECYEGRWLCPNNYTCKCGNNLCPSGSQCDNGQCTCFGDPVMTGYTCDPWHEGEQTCNQDSCKCGSETIHRDQNCYHNVPVCSDSIKNRCMCERHLLPDGYTCGEKGDFVCQNEDGCICSESKCLKNEKCLDGQCSIPSWMCEGESDTLEEYGGYYATTCKNNMWCSHDASDAIEYCMCPDGQSVIYSYSDDSGEHKQSCPTQDYISTYSPYKDRIKYSGEGLYGNAYLLTCGTDFVPEKLDSYVCSIHDALECTSCDSGCYQYPGYDGWLCIEPSGCGCGTSICPMGSFCTKENGEFVCSYKNSVYEKVCDIKANPIVCQSFSADLTPEDIARGGLLPVEYHSDILFDTLNPDDLPVGWICPDDAGCACGNEICQKGHFCFGPGHCSLNTGTIPDMTFESWILGKEAD